MTIKTKITLAYAVVFGVVLMAFAFIVYRSLYDAEVSKLDAFLATHAQKLQAEIEEQHGEHRFPDVGEMAALQTEGLADVRFQLYDSSGGSVVTDTVLPPLAPARSGLEASPVFSTLLAGGNDYRTLVTPVEVSDRNLYLLEIATPFTPVQSTFQRLLLLFSIAVPITILIAAAAARAITHAAFKPISTMVQTAEHISAENLSTRLELPVARDEIRELGETLNGMMDRIHAAFNSQRQFVADASHELRTPLTVICNELEYALQKSPDDEVKESIRIALGEADRLSKMTGGLLLLSKLDTSRLTLRSESLRLDELLMECVQLMRGPCKQKHIAVDVQVETAVELCGDGEKLTSAFLNLLDNAVKYSGNGSEVCVSLTTDDACAVVKIRDAGCGIAPSDLPHVFDRFYRASSSRGETEGSGLGLAIVDRVVKLHHGSLRLESLPATGTTVTVKLPLPGQ